MRELSLIVLCFLLLSSCKKLDKLQDDPVSLPMLVSNLTFETDSEDSVVNYIFINLSKKVIPEGFDEPRFDNQAVVGAVFKDSLGNLTSVGTLSIDNNTVDINSSSSYSFSSVMNNEHGQTYSLMSQDFKSLYGEDFSISIDGNSRFSGFSQTAHMPADLSLTTSLPYTTTYVKGNPMTFNWVPDASNQSGNVYINVYYYSELSRSENAALPVSITPLTYLVPDNGSFTVSSSDLNNFPSGCYFGYTVGRVNSYVKPSQSSDAKTYIYAIVQTSSKPIRASSRPTTYIRLERTNDYYYSDPYYTIETTDYVIRFYSDAGGIVPSTLVEDLPVGYSLTNHEWNNWGYDNWFYSSGTINNSSGTIENVYDIGYTELLSISDGQYVTNAISLTNGLHYQVIN